MLELSVAVKIQCNYIWGRFQASFVWSAYQVYLVTNDSRHGRKRLGSITYTSDDAKRWPVN